jgi:cell wall-associated NlpC family hydrolase
MQQMAKSIICHKILTMPYVVAVTGVVPMRSEPSHKSEMVNQLLFGEVGEVLADAKDFTRVKCLYDGYEGWCAKSQLAEVDDAGAFEAVGFIDITNGEALLNNTVISLPIATPIFENVSIGNYSISFKDSTKQKAEALSKAGRVQQLAYQYLNTPYLWGGKSNFGIDCSGFTQQVFKLVHKHLLRDAYQQATQGEVVGFLQEAQCGDLAFFDNDEGRITHVGILLDSETIIHASGYVRVDKIDNQGIIHSVTGRRTHKLRIIKRM